MMNQRSAVGNKDFLYISSIWAFRLELNRYKFPKPSFTVRCTNLLVEVDQARGTLTYPQTEGSSVKIALLQSRSILSFAQASRFVPWFSPNKSFFTVLHHLISRARRWVRIATDDISTPFYFNFAAPWRNDKPGFRENKFTICFSTLLSTFPIEPLSGKSSTVFVSLYSRTHLLTNGFDFFMYLAAAV